jgi:hypothetical protein
MTDRDLLNKLHDQSFQPFRVRLSNNSTIDVLDPPKSRGWAASGPREFLCAFA